MAHLADLAPRADRREPANLAVHALRAVALAVLAAILTPALAEARPGDLDRSFGGDGKVRTAFGRQHARAFSAAIDSKGRIVAAGTCGDKVFAVARHRPNGRLDRSFSHNGKVKTRFGRDDDWTDANGVAIDSKGRIVAAGFTARLRGHFADLEFALARYKRDGRLDHSFSRNGKKTTNFVAGNTTSDDGAYSVAIDSHGRIVVAGVATGDFALARYKRDGSLDRSFGTRGKVTTDFAPGATRSYDEAHAVTIDRRGRIVATGYGATVSFALARYKPNGRLDRSFSGNGKVTTDFPGGGYALGYSAAIDSRGRMLAAGTYNDDVFALARYKRDGSLDASFGAGGKVTTAFGGGRRTVARSVAIDSRDRIVAAGNVKAEGAFALARYKRDGSLDSAFGTGGTVTTDFGGRYIGNAQSVAIDSRDRIVAAGFARRGFALTRYIGYLPS
jgi:uncharacterized delta-60 repeat protein